MSRNYGLGTRDMASAGRIALDRASAKGELSYASVATISERWNQFSAFAKGNGVGRMERITPELVRDYGKSLSENVLAGRMSPAYAQNLVSAVNSVLGQVREWQSVSPTKACGIPERSNVRDTPPVGVERGLELANVRAELISVGQERAAALVQLAREFGLRSKEASLLNANLALKEAQSKGKVTITEGTKGGRSREVPILNVEQIAALKEAAEIQGKGQSLIPTNQNWQQWREGTLRDTRETLQRHGIERLHDLRAAYACDRYNAITGEKAPVFGEKVQDKDLDRAARETISRELGHNRIDILTSYVGGRG